MHGDWFASVDGEWLKEFFESIDYLTWVSNQPSPRKSVLKNPGETQIVPGFQYGEFYEVAPPSERTCNEWRKEAAAGSPTSAAPPSEVTPVRQPMLQTVTQTPPKVPKPLAKVALAADKRLQQKLAKGAKAPAKKVSPKKASQAQAKTQKSKQPKAKRNSNGPMQDTMNSFFAMHRKAGKLSYREIQERWLKSSQRKAIISAMSPAERRKRRFE